MNREEAIARLNVIVDGIDRDQCESVDGWWENNFGVEFGAEKKRQLEELIEDLTLGPNRFSN